MTQISFPDTCETFKTIFKDKNNWEKENLKFYEKKYNHRPYKKTSSFPFTQTSTKFTIRRVRDKTILVLSSKAE